MEKIMDFEIIRSQHEPQKPQRFAVGKPTGTLYFVPNVLELERAIVLIGKGEMAGKEGQVWPVNVGELIPPGATIKITT
jgi:hypothetical protein